MNYTIAQSAKKFTTNERDEMKKLLVLGLFSSVSYAKSAIICEKRIEDLNFLISGEVIIYDETFLDKELDKFVVRKNFMKGVKSVSAPSFTEKQVCVTVSN